MIKKFSRGFGLIEAIIGLSVAAIFLVAFLNLILYTLRVSSANVKDFKAQVYLKELVEIMRDLEQTTEGWQKIENAIGTFCYPQENGNEWILISGTQNLENIYNRWIIIENTNEPKKKKVTANIQWNNGFQNKTDQIEIYVYNFMQ